MADRPDATVVEVDAAALAAAPRLPSRCAPHGLPAVDHVTFGIPSPAPRTRYQEAGAGALSAVAGVSRVVANTRVTTVTGWPVCGRCRGRRRALRLVTRVAFWAGLVGFVGGLVAGFAMSAGADQHAPAWLMVPIFAGLVALLAAAVPLTLGQPARIARAQTTPDGATVRFTDPDPEFARELRALVGS